MASVLRSHRGLARGPQGHAGRVRVAPYTPGRTGCEASWAVWWGPGSRRRHLHESAQAGWTRHTQDAHLDGLSSRARCEEGKVKVKCCSGGCGGGCGWAAALRLRRGLRQALPTKPLLGAQFSPQATQPHLALCLPPEQMCCDPLLFVLSTLKQPPPFLEITTLVPNPHYPTYCFVFVLFFGSNSASHHKVGKPLGSHLHLFVCQIGLLFCPLSDCNQHQRNNELSEIKVTENRLIVQMRLLKAALWTNV